MVVSPYSEVLSASEDQIQRGSRLIRHALSHGGEIGGQVERLFVSALKSLLPERVGVASGFVVDSMGGLSPQLDIILYDRFGAPRVFQDGELLVLPSECVYAAGEVKTRLGRRELTDCYSKAYKFKTLDRSAAILADGDILDYHMLYGEKSRVWLPCFFVLALESGTTSNFARALREVSDAASGSRKERVDIICSLDGNCGINATLKEGSRPPYDGDALLKVSLYGKPNDRFLTYPSDHPWTLFSVLLNGTMVQTPTTKVSMERYLGNYVL